jgi:hypothetical protein
MKSLINSTSLQEIKLKVKSGIQAKELLDWIIRNLNETHLNQTILYWAIQNCNKDYLTVTVAATNIPVKLPFGEAALADNKTCSFSVVQVVPTGIGAAFGGYAGDAAPTAKLLGSITNFVVTHPNVINASDFYGGTENTLYVEGYTLDQFMLGNVALLPIKSIRIGLIIDKTDKTVVDKILCAADAVRAVHGIDIIGYVTTDKRIGGTAQKMSAGAFTGFIENPKVLLKAAEKLISKGANAIAVTSRIRGISEVDLVNNYRGKTPHPIGGVEAIISRLLSSYFLLPSAHAPIVNSRILDESPSNFEYDPRSAGELISKTGLPCILMGLSKAPRVIKMDDLKDKKLRLTNALTINNVGAVVAPASALGGIPMLAAEKKGIPIISVAENRTVLNVTGEKLGMRHEIKAANYFEAAGIITALRAGIDIGSLRRPLHKLNQIC